MRGTKLWQSAGSPIIQGRSRTEKPIWQDWAVAEVLSVAAAVVVDVIFPWPPDTFPVPAADLFGSALVALQVAFLPAGVAVWLSRRTRLGTPWVAGGVVGTICAAAFLLWGTGA